MKVADGAANDQPVLRQLRGATRPNEKRHVATRLQQASAKIAPDRPCSDNKNSHFVQSSIGEGNRQAHRRSLSHAQACLRLVRSERWPP